MDRKEKLMPRGIPKWIRCYDNGDRSFDRYTVIFTKANIYCRNNAEISCFYLAMSAHPYHPQGFGQHGESRFPIDSHGHKNIGKRITFKELPPDCQKLVRSDYIDLWNLPSNDPAKYDHFNQTVVERKP
jgi:hypothetical protein